MASYAQAEFTLEYEDGTTSKITIGPFDTTDRVMLNVKANVIAFNESFGSDTAQLSLSKYGNVWSGISGAKLVNIDKTILF